MECAKRDEEVGLGSLFWWDKMSLLLSLFETVEYVVVQHFCMMPMSISLTAAIVKIQYSVW